MLTEDAFRSIPPTFRPEPFWGLNDRLSEPELRRQVGLMVEGGWGGFFIHPRHGLETPYLGEQYMAAIEAVVDEAAERELRVWLYDEHPFPSGSAGGLVGSERRDHRGRVLAANIHTRLTPIEGAVAYFELELDPRTRVPVRARRVEPGEESPSANRFLHLHDWQMPVGHTWLANHGNPFIHGFPATDLLNPGAVARFLELTYEAHRDRLGSRFGRTLVGAFSDIPTYNWHYGTPHPSVPWTPALPDRFRARHGYDIIDELASLFVDVGDYHAVRNDYWTLASDLFVEAYTEQVADWCHTNGIVYSAHYWGEEAPHWQVAWAGDVMHHFSHQDVIANDHILRNIDDPAGIKQAATVAEQLGKERVATEIYALSGYNLSYEERKWIGEWAYALGTNMLVPYIPSYSLRGRRKRDEPPSQFFQQPYWGDERVLNDYFGRLGYALSGGQRAVDVLLLQPLATARALFRPGAEIPPAWRPADDPYEGAGADLHPFTDDFRTTVDWLLRAHCDFHIGNERLMAEHGSLDGGRLRVGLGSYEVVIVPPSLTWSATTLDLLHRFAEAGGRVLALPPLPSLVDGRGPGRGVLPAGTEELPFTEAALAGAVADVAGKRVRIDGGSSLLHSYRIDAESSVHTLFLVNTSLEVSYESLAIDLLQLPSGNKIECWNLLDGTTRSLVAQTIDDGVRVRLDFPPGGSHLIVSRPAATAGAASAPSTDSARRNARPVPLDGAWRLRRDGPNALVLDVCSFASGREQSHPMPLWRAQEQLRRAGVGARFSATFEFEVDDVPAHASIAIEDPARYDMSVNGTVVSSDDAPPWFDPALLQVDVSGSLRRGTNVVELSGRIGIDTELEPLFLTGDFSVVGGPEVFRVARQTDEVVGRDLTKEGYPFLVGRPVLSQTIELAGFRSVQLELERLDAIAARVRLNGIDLGLVAWRPYLVDLTSAAHRGTNELEIELVTSLHNLFGPHHDRRGEVRHFVIDGVWTNRAEWTDDYFSVPVGVTGATLHVEDS